MKTIWNEKRINEWYSNLPWLTGCNFLPSNVINRLDMWQSYKREEHLAVTEKELAFAEKIGFNTIRIWANFDVFFKEPDEFMNTLSSYVELARKYHQKVMMVLAYEEDLPFGDKFVAKELGPQKLYYNHFNRDYEMECKHDEIGDWKHYLEYDELKPIYLDMVTRIVDKYKNDDAILCWNIYNEPGIKLHERAIPLLELLFKTVRDLDPKQPLSADVWRGTNEEGKIISVEEEKAFELSDFVSFHSYSKFEVFKNNINAALTWGKPVIVTEWLNRVNHNEFYDCYPWLKEKKIGSYIWGFVQGLTFTTEPWESIYSEIEKGHDMSKFDITRWQHELFRRNLKPYDYKEYNVLIETNKKQ